ncbi:MAG TPA: sigma-70 family RNA polymerase sigma factor [Steroidobacteraceae bacterium]|nr:sigma-70 family RNA polymerase sigma factor [Steroidobacteraceae bacterium]
MRINQHSESKPRRVTPVSGGGIDTAYAPQLLGEAEDIESVTHETPDADIHALMRAGQYRAAFEAVLPRYRERVFRLALSILRERAAAEDAAQDVFVRLWRALPGYNGSAQLSTWIYAITRNTCISLLRKRRPQISLDEPIGDDDGPGLQLAAPEYDDSAVASVERLLDKLPERYRQAVVLFYMEDQSYEQTAAALALPLGTVKALLHRARKRLIELARID